MGPNAAMPFNFSHRLRIRPQIAPVPPGPPSLPTLFIESLIGPSLSDSGRRHLASGRPATPFNFSPPLRVRPQIAPVPPSLPTLCIENLIGPSLSGRLHLASGGAWGAILFLPVYSSALAPGRHILLSSNTTRLEKGIK